MTDNGQVTSSWTISRSRERLTRLAGTQQDGASFRQETIGELKRVVGFDGWCWSSTDPLTGMTITGLADNPAMAGTVPLLFELEYGTGDVNTYRDLARTSGPARLFAATGGNPGRSRRWARLLGPAGVGDELRATLTERGRCWGHLVLYRDGGSPAFTAAHAGLLAPMLRRWAARQRHEVQRQLAADPAGPVPDGAGGQAVLLLDASGKLVAQSGLAGRLLAALPGRPDAADPPLVVTALNAWLTAHPQEAASEQVPVCDATGRWQIVQAHRLDGSIAPDTIAITVSAAVPAQLAALAMAAAGLTAREQHIAALVAAGLTTAQVAATAHIAPSTVQDHLRAIFRKLAVTDRHQLTARLLNRPPDRTLSHEAGNAGQLKCTTGQLRSCANREASGSPPAGPGWIAHGGSATAPARPSSW
jgi:DNA-binding CsgD family transcriptional regulator